jgi:hypothetical protein
MAFKHQNTRMILFLLLSLAAAPAGGIEPITVRGQSGQFVVRGLPMGPPPSGSSTGAVSYLRLDPTLTAVSLERIRRSLAAELGLGDQWRSPITVTTHPLQEDNPRVLITSVHYNDGWGYRLDLPEIVDKPRFMLAAVKVVLLEFANRHAITREAELPPWLAQGLAAALQETAMPTLALEPETGLSARTANVDPLGRARALLRRRPALTFTQLSLPDDEQWESDDGELYQTCAYLLVRELLRLRDGRACLAQMLARLPENLNWQTTFLNTFQSSFPRLIDIDKWYALSVTHLTGRERMSVWPLATSFEHLDEILATPVNVRMARNELPIPTEVKLQRVISEWDFTRQAPVLEKKLGQLDTLHLRSAPELAEVVREYYQALDAYWNRRLRNPPDAAVPRNRAPSRSSTREVVRRLDAADRKLEALRQQLQPTAKPVATARP